MNTVPETQATHDQSLQALAGATAANEDLIPSSKARATDASAGWDAYEVWRRLIKEARDRRQGMTL